MLAHVALHPFSTTIYFVFLLGLCVGTALATELLRRRFILASVAAGFALAAGFFYLIQYSDAGWWPWKQFCFWLHVRDLQRYRGEWFDYVLVIPDVAKWYLIPAYTASLVVRLGRKWHENSIPAT